MRFKMTCTFVASDIDLITCLTEVVRDPILNIHIVTRNLSPRKILLNKRINDGQLEKTKWSSSRAIYVSISFAERFQFRNCTAEMIIAVQDDVTSILNTPNKDDWSYVLH